MAQNNPPLNPISGCTEQETTALEAIAMGMLKVQAAKHAGYKNQQHLTKVLARPRCKAYLERLQEQAQQRFQITRDDVINGLRKAIDDASMLSDPSSQISGWREIGKMLGYYAPEEKKIVLTTDQQQLREQLEELSDEDLLRLSGGSSLDVIDGDWEEVDN